MVNSRDIPNKMLKTNTVPGSRGHVGVVTDSKVEGSQAMFSGKDSIGTNSRTQGKKSAGNIGASNANHV